MVEKDVVIDQMGRIAAIVRDRAEDLTAEMIDLYARELPHLVRDEESVVGLLSASLYQNIETALQIFQHDIDPTRVEAPAAAMEYARRLAQRGTPVIDLIRAYYLAVSAILEHGVAVIGKEVTGTEMMAAVMSRTLTVTFAFIDRVIQQVVSAYQEERDRWLLNRSTARAARVRALLAGDATDLDAAELDLGYRLRGVHVAMIVWCAPDSVEGNALSRLEAVATEIGACAGALGPPLFVPNDELCAWVWFPLEVPELPDEKQVERVLGAAEPGIRLVLGEPGPGVEGFRRSHNQAQRVRALALAAGEHCDRALTFRDVGALALMAADLGAARQWVADTLGPLAIDDEQHERLRDTLRVFLAAGGSYTASAAQLMMHKNSVQYRVRKAEETLGRPVADNRLDLELALKLCHRLGSAVLVRKSS
ncbi:PucR family transcriptional regulator [Amycolatopsis taiwanensis]|uniref:ABC transporter substrate-binding protein n=1 Tax=Amycolatopsis taiwanensis TaxID=342230 RepID=A0A9W6R8F5_9PSEU|nr:helix-turn-helix domain-containing protein [Amycolatopsis taiwanensis]GLY69462.1 ABC transporter substrate-binding protein [Amycolatopsis taiwanensis]